MATTTEGAIKEALFVRLVDLVLNPFHPISWPNLNFTPPADNRYIEARHVPNSVERMVIDTDGPHLRQGFLQINVRDALNQGTRIDDIAGAVAAHFPADLRLHHAFGLSVRITADPAPSPMIVENTPPGVLVPVLVAWECWA
jgi:hypothetical protein